MQIQLVSNLNIFRAEPGTLPDSFKLSRNYAWLARAGRRLWDNLPEIA